MAPWWWFPCKPKHVGAVLFILKCFNNSTFLNVLCISWRLNCWILLMHGVTMKFDVTSSFACTPEIRWCQEFQTTSGQYYSFNKICFYKRRCALNTFRTKVCARLWLRTGGTCSSQFQGRTDRSGDSLLRTSKNNNVKVGLKRTWGQKVSPKRR